MDLVNDRFCNGGIIVKVVHCAVLSHAYCVDSHLPCFGSHLLCSVSHTASTQMRMLCFDSHLLCWSHTQPHSDALAVF